MLKIAEIAQSCLKLPKITAILTQCVTLGREFQILGCPKLPKLLKIAEIAQSCLKLPKLLKVAQIA